MEYEPKKIFFSLMKNKDFQNQFLISIQKDYENKKKELAQKKKQQKNQINKIPEKSHLNNDEKEIKTKEKEKKFKSQINKFDNQISLREELNLVNSTTKSLENNKSIFEKEEFLK